METHRLRYFLHIAEEGSISRAAAVLGIAQPALSRQVRLLEEDLGVRLFQRTSRGVQLTEAGERLRDTTTGPLRQLELAMQYVGSPLARVEQGVHLGMIETVAPILGAPLLAALHLAFPHVVFDVVVAGTDQLVAGMLKGTVDVALLNPVADDRLFYSDLLVEPLGVVGGPRWNGATERGVTFDELTRLPVALPSCLTGITNTVQHTALRLQVRVTSPLVSDSLDLVKNLVAAEQVWSVMPMSACRAEVASGRLRWAPLTEPALEQQIGMGATSQLRLPTGFATRVGQIIRDEATELIRAGTWPARPLEPPRPRR